MMAIDYDEGPSVLGLNRTAVPLLEGTDRHKVQRGAYIISEDQDAKVTLISTGGDLFRAVEAVKMLNATGIRTRVVSMPCMRRFEQQDEEYIRTIIPWDGRPIVSFEAMSTHGWAKWATASIGQQEFGINLVADYVFPYFKMTGQHIFERVRTYLSEMGDRDARSVPWKNI
jgi:transketolase